MVNLTKIVAALLVVVAALLGIFAWTLTRHAAPPPIAASTAAPTFAVVVAAHPLHAGEALKAADLQLAQLPLSPPGAYADVGSLVGRVPLGDLGTGLPIVESALLAGLAGRLAPGERAVAIKVDELAGVGGRVRPGDSVDLFMLLRRDGADGEIGRTQARLLLSKVRVLAYGRAAVTQSGSGNAVPAPAPDGARDGNALAAAANSAQVDAGTPPSGAPGANDPVNARTAVVAVPVEHVDALALADSAGRLVMALRNPTDAEVVDRDTFAPAGTVLVAAGGQAALATEPSNHAAAGLLLDQLVSDKGAKSSAGNPNTMPLPVQASLPPLSERASARPVAMSRGSSGGVEVIRGDKREMVGW
jgi:pilus assembly protein CpaB